MYKKYSLIFILLIAIFLIFGGCTGNKAEPAEPSQDDASIIFFYGKECPHCQNVEEYFAKNNVSDKIQFSQREVYHDKGNAALMGQKAKNCGVGKDELGVPMLWNEGTCFFGDQDIIQFFQQKISANQ